MQIASWNVNSIRARLERVVAWLESRRPDVLCLQETKVQDADFPRAAFAAAGYEVVAHGQKTYNGVAIAARAALADAARGFDAGEDEGGARLVGATVGSVRVYCVYVPNGQVVGSAAWDDKLRWMARLRRLLETRHTSADRLALCGDFNIAPEERDVHDPELWKGQVLFHPEARAAWRGLCAWGLVDTLRLHHDAGGLYSWWDYRMLAFPKNLGLRIDHILASEPLARRCRDAGIDREARKGPGPSDHAPVLASFDL